MRQSLVPLIHSVTDTWFRFDAITQFFLLLITEQKTVFKQILQKIQNLFEHNFFSLNFIY